MHSFVMLNALLYYNSHEGRGVEWRVSISNVHYRTVNYVYDYIAYQFTLFFQYINGYTISKYSFKITIKWFMDGFNKIKGN